MSALVSTTPGDLQVDQIESELLGSTAPTALHNYGVAVEQVRLERISLPEENVTAVLQQMRAERGAIRGRSTTPRAEREASRIVDPKPSLRKAAQLIAKGTEEEARASRRLGGTGREDLFRGAQGGSRALSIHASLDSLDKLVTANTSLILRTDSEPCSLLQSKSP